MIRFSISEERTQALAGRMHPKGTVRPEPHSRHNRVPGNRAMRPIPNRDGAIPDHTSLRQAGHTNRRPSLAERIRRRPSLAGHTRRRAIRDRRSLGRHASRRSVRSHIGS